MGYMGIDVKPWIVMSGHALLSSAQKSLGQNAGRNPPRNHPGGNRTGMRRASGIGHQSA
jgi:hypothetical protein